MKVSALDALLLLFLINLVLQPPTEPDFGWHLRAGIDLIDHGWRMPETDPYSHTMPDWRWIEHAWLSDGILGVLSTSLGAFGLLAIIVLFGIVTGGAFLLAASTSQASWTARLLASVAALWAALPFLGARIQMITLLGVAVLLWLWRRAAAQPAVLWLVPPLFLLWANLHGGFTAGLFTLGLMLIVATGLHLSSRTGWDEPLPSRRLLTRWAIAVSAAAAVTVLNPYGLDLHREIVSSLTDRYMLETLHEWQPVTLAEPAGRAYALYAGLLL
ncbi:MAG TPA: hypothetical protein VFA38_07910, partial [Nitrospirales bacterium]|nr:hypothetical protein [Nitrospirales bacterium]